MRRIIVMGAAGRDFHNFNVLFRERRDCRVVAFTATQIPDIHGRRYPSELAGDLYPEGIPIHPEDEAEALVQRLNADLAVFSYSDIAHQEVMQRASRMSAAGADFLLVGARRTMLTSRRPVVAVCAVRTGCGKSPTTRKVAAILRNRGKKAVVVRHPMPYGDLARQAVQRFASGADLDRHNCTIEEREEYEPLLEEGITVFAGVDYARILKEAEGEGEILIWDGGNNDTPFFVPDVNIVLLDPHRPGHEHLYWPGEVNLRMADIAVIHKVDSASKEGVEQVRRSISGSNPAAAVVQADLELRVERPEEIGGRRVLVVEDGPTLTHGEMPTGAGFLAARRYGAAEIVDPRPFAVGSLEGVFRSHPHIGPVLPAMGYGREQRDDLRRTIEAAECDLVLFATPIDLGGLLDLGRCSLRVRYAYCDHGEPTLERELLRRLDGMAGA